MSSCNRSSNPTRREALRRLGLAVTAAYVAPSVLLVSEARAATSGASEPSTPTTTSPPTPPTPPTAPSNIEEIEADVTETDSCKSTRSTANPDAPVISASDFKRAQEAVDAGYAKPLDAIWSTFIADYPGKVISIEFTGYRWRPRFRFKAISASGRLETVIVSARTGEIEKVVGC